jgi:hypothetical protein
MKTILQSLKALELVRLNLCSCRRFVSTRPRKWILPTPTRGPILSLPQRVGVAKPTTARTSTNKLSSRPNGVVGNIPVAQKGDSGTRRAQIRSISHRSSLRMALKKSKTRPLRNAKLEPWAAHKNTLWKRFPYGWRPDRKVSPEAMEGIRTLHRQVCNL